MQQPATKRVLLVATVQSHICQFHRPLIEMLHQSGFEVHVAANNNLAEKNDLKLDFVEQIFDIPFARSPKSLSNFKAYRRLKHLIDTGNYAIIHCNTPMGGIVTRLAARNTRKKNNTQVFYTAHGFHFYRGASILAWLIYYPIEKYFCRFTDKLITINREDYELAKRKMAVQSYFLHGVGVNEHRYHPLADPLSAQHLRKELGFEASHRIILCVGELLPNKNQEMAIRMMATLHRNYPEVILVLAGNGPKRKFLEQIIIKNNLQECIRMIGYCTHLEKYQQLADISISCSYREGLPLNIVEAMLSATPVIATSNRGHCELIEHGETGYLVPANDALALAEQVKFLLQHEDCRSKMGDNAQKFALQYGYETVKQELKYIYEIQE